jgi:PKD repeat protein
MAFVATTSAAPPQGNVTVHSATSGPTNDTNGTWTNITGNVTGSNLLPEQPQQYNLIAFDAHDNYTILFTEYEAQGGTYADTLKYHGGQWTNLTGAGGPAGRSEGVLSAMAYDPAIKGGGVFLFDGVNDSTWFFQGGVWTELETTGAGSGGPSYYRLSGPMMTYDAHDGYLLFSNGYENSSLCNGGPLSCTGNDSVWSLSSDLVWSSVASLPSEPSEYGENFYDAVQPVMAYDNAIQSVVAINDGGEAYTYAAGNWTNASWNIQQTGVSLADSNAIVGESFAYDPRIASVLLFGGGCFEADFDVFPCNSNPSIWNSGYNDTWIDESGNWTNVSGPSDPSPRAFVAITYDEADGYMLAAGGQGELRNVSSDQPVDASIGSQTWVYSNEPVTVSPVNHVTMSASPNPTDVGTPVNLSVSFSGNHAPFTYLWSNATTNWTTATNQTTLTWEIPGTYLVAVTVTDHVGTYQTSTLNVTINPLSLTLTSSPNPTDVGVPVNLSVSFSSGQTPFSCLWSNGAVTNHTTETWETPGTYPVTVTVTNHFGINQSAMLNVTVNPSPGASFNFATKQTVGLPENFNGYGSNGTGPYQYTWNFGDGTASTTSGVHTYSQPGTYDVTFTVTDALAQSTTANETVTVAPVIVASLSVTNSTPSIEQSVLFTTTASGGLGAYTYAWSGLPVGCASVNNANIGCAPTQSGTYLVMVNVTDGYPGAASATVNVTVIFEFTLSVSTTTLQVGQNVTVGVQSATPATDLTYSYSGLPPGCASENTAQLTCSPTATGNYTVTVTVTDVAASVSASHKFSLDVVAATTTPPGGKETVTFTETGLPSGTSWSVTLGGTLASSTTSTLQFAEANGSYAYSIGVVTGYGTNPSNGTLTVIGAPLSIAVAFEKVYALTFTETALPTGTNWSVTLTGSASSVILITPLGSGLATLTRWSDGASTIQFYVSNGTYSYSCSASGYSSSTGSLTVNGQSPAPATVGLTSSSSSSSGFPTLDYVIIGVVVVVVAIGVGVVLMRRRGRAPPAPVPSASQPGRGAPPAPP